jgi:hypothetical protein
MRKDINTGGKYLTAINGKFSNGVYTINAWTRSERCSRRGILYKYTTFGTL